MSEPATRHAHLRIPRDRAAALGREMVAIIQAGRYVAPSGRTIDVRDQIAAAVAGTVSYPPEEAAPAPKSLGTATQVEVRNETTLAAARRLLDAGHRPAALNFASATEPGGGFLHGARAQEEYLARSSALWACLHHQPMYEFHRAQADPFYSDWVIYSPAVPVLRADDHALLESPWPCAMVTAPAVMAYHVALACPERAALIPDVMRTRAHKVLAAFAAHGHDAIVLGAWGCGAFGNDGPTIAGLFREALAGPFAGIFRHVTFAITDWSDDAHFIGPFLDAFGDSATGIPHR